MRSHRTLRHAVISAMLLVAFLSQGTWALAGVTGNITGSVKDSSGAPIAGAQVQAVAPSGTRTATTDAGGHFVMLSLGPDTYTLTLTKEGYQGISFPGVTVFADQTQTVAYTMSKALRTIAHVTSSSGASLVKSGVGGDLYSVNSAQAAAAQALGGGGNLNSAYSAMASVPGIQTSQGGIGWTFNAAYVRGQDYYYTAFEYDGIPVNRAFDNYNASTESSLGLQELQVYTGGGPASVASAGTSGFINQVIKTGTFPGFATANLGIGTPAYYHQASVEVGGSTPDRTFSWYVGLLGFNQNYNFFDSTNGAGYQVPGGIFSGNTDGAGIGYGFGSNQVLNVGYMCIFATCQGVKPICQQVTSKSFSYPDQGCWQYYSGTTDNPFMITDRENVVNLHMGIPKANGLRDDVQFLWSGSAVNNTFYQSQNDMGPGVNQLIYALYGTHAAAPTCGPTQIANGPGGVGGLTVNGCSGQGQIASYLQPEQYFFNHFYPPSYQPPYICPAQPIACGKNYLGYSDGVAYDLPFGSSVYSQKNGYRAPGVYMMPDTPAHPFDGPLPINDNSINSYQNNTGVTKLQYTYALSQSAYLRAYGYTFYSDWLQLSPTFLAAGENVPSTPAGQYDLMTHTSGGALDFQDQINDQNLVSVDGNYTSASVVRFNNGSAFNNNSPIGYMAKTGNGFTCYGNQANNPTAKFGYSVPCLSSSYYQVTTGSACPPSGPSTCAILTHPTWTSSAAAGPQAGFGAPGSPAARAGATWDSLWNGNVTGSLNTVKPRFTNASLSDQFRPSDKWLINAALRYDNFTYDMPNQAGTADQFYANMTANYTCVLASTNQIMTAPLGPGAIPPAPTIYVNGDCNKAAQSLFKTGPKTGWVHPNGTLQDGVTAPNFTANSPASYSLDYWQPRFSATYTASPDTVFRASAGRFTQPPITASVQYLSASGDNRSVWNNTINLGFYSPFHPIPGISSSQYDFSWEQHLKGTDMSFKLTPFYTWVNDWQQQTFIGAGFVTQVPVGVNRNYGVEFQFNKGDFSRNGLSGLVAFTYTNSKVMFQNVPLSTGGSVTNELIPLNQVISQYNALTKAGGGSPCYQGLNGVPCSTKNSSSQDTILNPYYNKAEQPQLDLGAWYNPYVTAIAPNLNAALGSYISPEVASLIVNYRHDKFAVTPSISFQTGGYYGSPLDINGYDPRACVANSAATGITGLSPKTNPLQCDIRTVQAPGFGPQGLLYIPDPQTGTFAFDNYQNPSSLVGNLQVTYDLSPKIRLSMLGSNLFHTCFGGTSTPWSAAYAPSNVICGYTPAGGLLNSSLYPSNWFLGTGINDFAANKARTPSAFQQSYIPGAVNNGAIGAAVLPINLYFNATVKI
ncbi:MAG: TonB-dependent receptor [Candidatus Cybelea sp.]